MSVRILHDRDEGIAALYCSTSGFAFGVIFEGADGHTDAGAAALCFLNWADAVGYTDTRLWAGVEFEPRYQQWLNVISGGTWTGSLDGDCAICDGSGELDKAALEAVLT